MTRLYRKLIVCCLPLCWLLAGCTMNPSAAEREKMPSRCAALPTTATGLSTAERHYEYMVACVEKSHYREASFHYAIAGVLTWYDYLLNPGDATKARHQSELRIQLSRLTEKEKQQLWRALNSRMHDKQDLSMLCSIMVISESDIRTKMLWDKAKNGYLHCGNERML